MALSSAYTDRPSMDEVINDPTNARHYWRYRVHVTLETLLQDDAMCKLMQVSMSGFKDLQFQGCL